jgi:Ricin-type beta-trefoil lectin domain-like
MRSLSILLLMALGAAIPAAAQTQQEGVKENPATPGVVAQERTFTAIIKVKHSGKCIDVWGNSSGDGAPVYQWPCHGGNNQKWDFVPTGTGYHTIRAVHSGKCMDINGAYKNFGIVVWQWGCHGGDNQEFKVTADVPGYYKLSPKHSGLCLDILGNLQENAVVLWQWGCHTYDNQKFQLVQ